MLSTGMYLNSHSVRCFRHWIQAEYWVFPFITYNITSEGRPVFVYCIYLSLLGHWFVFGLHCCCFVIFLNWLCGIRVGRYLYPKTIIISLYSTLAVSSRNLGVNDQGKWKVFSVPEMRQIWSNMWQFAFVIAYTVVILWLKTLFFSSDVNILFFLTWIVCVLQHERLYKNLTFLVWTKVSA